MDDYTFDNVLIDPNKEGIDGLIGKEVYFHDNPSFCVVNANRKSNDNLGILVEICEVSTNPFLIKLNDGTVHAYPCIIEKKKGETEYSEFESQEEFLNHYAYHRDKLVESSLNRQLSSFGGVWLKRKKSNVLYMVIEIWDDGVVLGDSKMKTTSQGYEEYITMNTATLWKELCEKYTFLDGTSCGKEKK